MMCNDNECSGHMNDVHWTQIDCQLLVVSDSPWESPDGLHPPRHPALLHQVGELRVGAPHVVLPLPVTHQPAQHADKEKYFRRTEK